MDKKQEDPQRRNAAIDSLLAKLSRLSDGEALNLTLEEKDMLLDLRSEVMKWSDGPGNPPTSLQRAYLNKLAIKEKKAFIIAKIDKN